MNKLSPLLAPINRRTNHLEIPDAEINVCLKAVEKFFGDGWLRAGKVKHRLQKLWRRSDPLATTELVSLGHALVILESIDSNWVTRTVRAIRKEDSNCHGPFFELFACAMFASAGMTINLMGNSHPGYDAEILFDDGFKLCVSMKNHDMSAHERTFRERAATLRRDILRKLKETNASSQVVIQGLGYLDEREFQQLRREVEIARDVVDVEIEVAPARAAISFRKFPEEDESQFAKGYVSDSVIVLCPHHQNEKRNFRKKVEKAAWGLKARGRRSEDSSNVIMMRLHPSTSIDAVAADAAGLLNSSGDPGFDAIWLYQPSVIRQSAGSMVSHHFRVVLGGGFRAENHPVHMRALIGVVSTDPSRLELRSSNGLSCPVVGHYLFQRGDHYLAATKSGASLSGTCDSPAPGIHVHALFDIDNDKLLFSGKFPENEELSIL